MDGCLKISYFPTKSSRPDSNQGPFDFHRRYSRTLYQLSYRRVLFARQWKFRIYSTRRALTIVHEAHARRTHAPYCELANLRPQQISWIGKCWCLLLVVTRYAVQVALLVQWLGFLPSKQAARVRVPDGALFPRGAVRTNI